MPKRRTGAKFSVGSTQTWANRTEARLIQSITCAAYLDFVLKHLHGPKDSRGRRDDERLLPRLAELTHQSPAIPRLKLQNDTTIDNAVN